MSDDRNDHLIIPSLPVLYVPPAQYTDKTPVLTPLLIPALRALTVMGLEWTTLSFIESVPNIVRIATFVISGFILAVLECRGWLNFKQRNLFAFLIFGLIVIYTAICAYAFMYLQEPSTPNPAVTDLQTKLAAAFRDRDIAISERDAARREHGDNSPGQPIPQLPQSLKADEIDARLDAWKAVSTQMNDLASIISDGDNIVNNWKNSDNDSLSRNTVNFRNKYDVLHSRLNQTVGVNNQFSDLSVVDLRGLDKLDGYINNLLNAVGQRPNASSKGDWEAAIAPYIGPVKREMASLRQWVQTTRNVADLSVLELTARQQTGK